MDMGRRRGGVSGNCIAPTKTACPELIYKFSCVGDKPALVMRNVRLHMYFWLEITMTTDCDFYLTHSRLKPLSKCPANFASMLLLQCKN